MTTDVDVTKRALAQIGTHSQIISMTDGSEEALYANLLYLPLKDFLLAEGDYDFSIVAVPLVVSGTSTDNPWTFAYNYPAGALRIRSLIPTVYDPFDPVSIEFNVVSFSGVRSILTKVSAAKSIQTYSAPEDVWDPIFTESFTRLLASALAFSIENRIEASKEKLSEALNFAGIANLRDP
jgi:hypothetical protein